MKRRRLLIFVLLGLAAGYLYLRHRASQATAAAAPGPAMDYQSPYDSTAQQTTVDTPTVPGATGTVMAADLSAEAPMPTYLQQALNAGLLPSVYNPAALDSPVGLNQGLGGLPGLDQPQTVPAPQPIILGAQIRQGFFLERTVPAGTDKTGKKHRKHKPKKNKRDCGPDGDSGPCEDNRTRQRNTETDADGGAREDDLHHEKTTVDHIPHRSKHHKQGKRGKHLPNLPNGTSLAQLHDLSTFGNLDQLMTIGGL